MSILLFFVILWLVYEVLSYLWMLKISFDGVPGTWPIPIFGWNPIRVIKNVQKYHRVDWERKLPQKFNYFYRGWVRKIPCIAGSDHEVLRQVLMGKTWENWDRSTAELKWFGEFLGNGLILQRNGERWRAMRQLLTPLFSSQAVREHIELFKTRTNLLIEKLAKHAETPDARPIDLQDEIQKLTFDVIGEIAMGIDLDTQRSGNHQFADAWGDMLRQYMWRFAVGIPYWKLFTTDGEKKLAAAWATLNGVIFKTIEERRAILQAEAHGKKSLPNGGEEKPKIALDILTLLVEAQLSGETYNKESQPLSDTDIRDQVLTFLFAGHDTTTNFIVWALYHLSKEDEMRARLRAELKDLKAKGGDEANDISYEDLPKLEYMQAVLKETLRLHASVPIRGRTSLAPEVLHGHPLPKGQEFAFNAFTVHRRPDVWGEDSETFQPDRWLVPQSQQPPANAFLPFGLGPRRCIGEPTARAEALIVVAMLVKNFKFHVEENPPVEEELSITLRMKNGMFVRIAKDEL